MWHIKYRISRLQRSRMKKCFFHPLSHPSYSVLLPLSVFTSSTLNIEFSVMYIAIGFFTFVLSGTPQI